MLIVEIQSYASNKVIGGIAICFVAGRFIHAYAFLGKLKTSVHLMYRPLGMVMTMIANVALMYLVFNNGLKEIM